MYFVYILQCRDNSLYTGITTDVPRRIAEHTAGNGAHYTRVRGVKRLLYTEKHPDRSSASKREAEIKKWDRRKKWALTRVAEG